MYEIKSHIYSGNSEYEQCQVTFNLKDNYRTKYRIALARYSDWYRYEIRDASTLEYLFGKRNVTNKDSFGPFVLIDARRGFAGAVTTSFWDLSPSESERVYNICDGVRESLLDALASSPD